MGSSFSYLGSEEASWEDQSLMYDSEARRTNIKHLSVFENGSELFLGYQNLDYGNLNYQHWFVTDKTSSFGFHAPNGVLHSASVSVQTTVPAIFNYASGNCQKQMDSNILARMEQLVGLTNFSLCLRNSEHVAKYVFTGDWCSLQMSKGAILEAYFHKKMSREILDKVNLFPSNVSPQSCSDGRNEKIYTFHDKHYEATSLNYYLDESEDTYNILVIGTTGSGKSHLINMFFNKNVCASVASHKSVTKEVCFIRGRADIFNAAENQLQSRSVVVIDTIGLCDTEDSDEKTFGLIKNRISKKVKTLNAVFVVFQAGRLVTQTKNCLRLVLDWLKYDESNRHLNFMFVATHAESYNEEEIRDLHKEAMQILNIKPWSGLHGPDGTFEKYESLVYTGFPPEECLNDKTKAGVLRSLRTLQPLLHPDGTLLLEKQTIPLPSYQCRIL